MRGIEWTALRRFTRLSVCGALVLLSSCDGTKEPTHPLLFGYFVHPGAVDAGSPSEVRAGVYVGGSGCWHLGGASLVRDGNRLVLSGYAVGESGPAVCPALRVYDTLTLAIPPLEVGEYRLEAGDLADTLYVGSPAPRPAGRAFAARGSLASHGSPCILFTCPYPGGDEVSGILEPPPMAQPLPQEVVVVGSVAGRDSCGGREHPLLRVRHMVFE